MSEQADDLRELYELHALGLLEEPERSQVEESLAAGSAEHRARFKQALENNAVLMASVPEAEPPMRLRSKVLALAGEQPKSNWSWGWAAGLAAVAAAGLIGVFHFSSQSSQRATQLASVRQELQQVSEQAARTNTELVKARAILNLLNSPETRFVTFGPEDPKPKGKVLVHPSRGVLLIASNLPPAPAGKIYEMWVIPKGAKPVPAGLFQTDSSGFGMHFQESAIAEGSAVAVTLEPESGSGQPTTTPLLVVAAM